MVRPKWMLACTFAAVAAAIVFRAPQADLAAQARVSRPGAYVGYAARKYDGYQRTSFYIPARDGTRLAVDLFRPTSNGVLVAEPLPVVWMHSPYNRRTYRNGEAAATYPGYALQLLPYGYIIAVADFRGVYASFGQNRAYNRGEWLDAARMDAYDISEWFARQPWSNGRIGMWGCSATGGSQMQAATTAPPSLKAIMPMSAEFDAYSFQVNGGVAPPPGAPLRALPGPEVRDRGAVAVDGPEGAALLQAATAGHLRDGDAIGDVPFRDSVSKPTGLMWWLKSSPHMYLDAIRKSGIGVYAVANWDEAGTKHGAFLTARNLGRQAKLLVGPAAHCAWAQVKADTGFDIVAEELRFFDYWLKGVQNGVMDEPAVTYYTYNAPPGEEWRRASAWPLANEVRTAFYLGGGELTRNRPTSAGSDEVGLNALVETSTSTTSARGGAENVLLYQTAPLPADLELTGHPVVHLWMAATARDADIVARLDDVAPDGRVRSHNMQGQFRASRRALADAPYDNLGLPWHSHAAADAKPLEANEAVEVQFELLPMSYIFKAGHRLRLSLFFADTTSPRSPDVTSRISVWRSPDRPSFVTLPVIPAAPRAAASSGSQPACDRPCLIGFTNRYIDALLAHDPSPLPLAATVTYTENGTGMKPGDGLWRSVTSLVARREVFADAASGHAAFWAVFSEQGSPVIVSVRLKIQSQRITEVETVAARKGSHALFSPDTFAAAAPVFEQVLAPSQHTPREHLIAAADAYFDGLERHDQRLVPSAVDCNRYENGVLMTNRPGAPPTPRACAAAVDRLTHIKAVTNRRHHVVDEDRGVVLSMVEFDIPADAAATPPRPARTLLLAEVFKVVGGEIVRLETVMHNLPYGAGSGWTAP